MEKVITCSSCNECYSIIPIGSCSGYPEYCCFCGSTLDEEEIETDYDVDAWGTESDWEE